MQFSDYQQFFSTAFVDVDGKAQQPFDYQPRVTLKGKSASLLRALAMADSCFTVLWIL